ncbi:MAG: tetratricopeptide repeat protein [Prevotella sp.]
MKKIMFMAVALASAATAFAQDDLVKQALKEKNPAEAVKIITPALTSDQTTNKAAAWGAMSDIQYQFYSNAYEQMVQNQFKSEKTPIDTVGMYNGIVGAFNAAFKCDEFDILPNEKGKVKPKYRSKNASRLSPVRNTLIDAGGYYYGKKEYDKSYEAFSVFVNSADAPLFDGKIVKDSTYYLIANYAALAAYLNKDYTNAAKYATIAIDDAKVKAEAMNILISSQKESCKTKEDSVAYFNKLNEIRAKDPNELTILFAINEYLSAPERVAEKEAWCAQEVKKVPGDKYVWAFLGESQMNQQKYEEAVASFKKSLEIDPSFIEVQYNVGASLVLQATALKDQLSGATGRLSAADATKVKNIYLEAKDYLEKIKAADPDRQKVNWAYTLYQVYYGLGDAEKAAEIEKIIGGGY